MPAEVCNGEDHCGLGLHDEEDAEWKPVENRSPELMKDQRKALRTFLDSRKCRPKFSEKFHPEAGPLAVVPGGRFERVEFCLRPNLQPQHLPSGAEALLYASDDFFPWTSLVGRSTMCGEALFQERLLPFLQGNLTDRRGDAIPEGLYVVDLFVDRERVEARRGHGQGHDRNIPPARRGAAGVNVSGKVSCILPGGRS